MWLRHIMLAWLCLALVSATAAPAAAPPLSTQLQEIQPLRQNLNKAFSARDERTVVADLTKELALGEQILRAARHAENDAQMHALIQYLSADDDLLFTMVAQHPTDGGLAKLGLAYVTAHRGRFTREQFGEFRNWKAAVAHAEPALWDSLRQAEDRFTDLSISPLLGGELHRDQIRQQAKTIADLEGRIFAGGGLPREFSMATSTDIVADMGVDRLVAGVNFGKVLIAYVQYDEVRGSNDGAVTREESRYLAIVGHAGSPLRAVPLGSAADIDKSANAFLDSVKEPPKSADSFDKRAAQDLYRRIVAPIQPYFKYGAMNFRPILMISADGALLCIPFSALLDGDTFLIDEDRIELIDSPSDAALIARSNLAPKTNLLALSNPSLRAGVAKQLQPLAQADREAAQIAALWPQDQERVLRQSAATVAALESDAATAGILHIATHGLFAPNSMGVTEAQTLSAQDIESDLTGMMSSSLSRSIILLSPSANGSGFFSALDVSSLDLSHTQLVVLAACNSGTGDRERGEGIYGLRRAFLEAGAETVVSSLWAVDSAATREMMVSFYRNLFQGQARGDALQHAEAFTRLKYAHPYYWASFVITGNLGGLHLPKDN